MVCIPWQLQLVSWQKKRRPEYGSSQDARTESRTGVCKVQALTLLAYLSSSPQGLHIAPTLSALRVAAKYVELSMLFPSAFVLWENQFPQKV